MSCKHNIIVYSVKNYPQFIFGFNEGFSTNRPDLKKLLRRAKNPNSFGCLRANVISLLFQPSIVLKIISLGPELEIKGGLLIIYSDTKL